MADRLIAMCRDGKAAQDCVDRLRAAGLAGDDIGLVMRGYGESRRLAQTRGVRAGRIAGDGAAGILEEIKEWIEGIASPGRDEAAWGADLVDKLVAKGISPQDARWCRDQVNGGAVLLSARCEEDECDEVTGFLAGCGARLLAPGRASAAGGPRVPLVEEQLEVARRPVERGEVLIAKGLHGEQRELHVHVLHEEITIERRPADRVVEQGIGEVETIRVPLREERVELVKRPRVVEELVIRKQLVTEERDVSGTIRREVPRVSTKGEIEQWVHEERPEQVREEQPGHLKERETGRECLEET